MTDISLYLEVPKEEEESDNGNSEDEIDIIDRVH
jgi:hypothetical protein